MSTLSRSLRWLLSGGLLALCSAEAPARAWNKKEETVIATGSAAGPGRRRTEPERRGPELRPDDVFAGKGEVLHDLVGGQLKVLQRLLAATPEGDPERPDLLFRLAEHCAEQQRFHSFRARELDERIFRAQKDQNADEVRRLKARQATHEAQEREWLREAVRNYLVVATGPAYASYAKMDQVLYSLAYLLTQIKKDEQARVYFKRLIKDYPNSPYLPHAFLSFAEAAFEARDLESALRFYDRVLAYGDGPSHGFALYKKAWVYYNLTDFKQALSTFAAVIDRQVERERAGRKGDAVLLREARKDLVRTYAQIGSAERAWAFLQRYGGKSAPALLEQLGELYFAQGHFGESIKTYRELIHLSPESPRLCSWQAEVLRNTLSLTGARAVPDTVKELQRLAAVHDRIAGQAGVRPEAVRECRDATAGMLRDLATGWHKEAQRTRDTATFAHAAALYREYLRRFDGERDSAGLRYYYGELLYQLGAQDSAPRWYCDAAPVYDEVVRRDPRGPRARDAALAAVISWNGCLELDREREPVPGEHQAGAPPPRPRPLPAPQQRLIEAMRTYAGLVPHTAAAAAEPCGDRAVIVYRWARTLYLYDHLREAAPLFREVTERHATCPQGVPAANLLLDSLALLQDDDALTSELARLRRTPAYASVSDRELPLRTVEMGLLRRSIERREKAGEHREAGVLYLQLAERFPDDPHLDEVYNNAAVNLEQARLIGLAIQARERLMTARPDSPLARRAIFRMAQNYHALAAFEQAAERYEDFATRYGGEIAADAKDDTQIDAPRALRTAAFFRRGLGQTEQSVKDVRRFIGNYGGHKALREQAAAAFFEMAQVYEQQGDRDKLRRHLQEYLQHWGEAGGIDRRIVAEVRLGQLLWQQSCPVAGQSGACIEVQRVRASTATLGVRTALRRLGRGAEVSRQCGPPTKSKITVYPRNPALSREAEGHFGKALALWQGGAALSQMPKDDAGREARVASIRYHLSLARMAEGDRRYEEMLALRMPGGLNFARRGREYEASKRRLMGWYQHKARSIEEARRLYQEVITTYQDPHHAIAAAARIGQLYQDFASALYTAEVPQPPAPPPGLARDEWGEMFRQAYCDEMEDLARAPEEKAVQGLDACLAKSTGLSWYNEWSRLCEAELNQLKPREYPLATEIRPEPGYLGMRLDVAPVIPASL